MKGTVVMFANIHPDFLLHFNVGSLGSQLYLLVPSLIKGWFSTQNIVCLFIIPLTRPFKNNAVIKLSTIVVASMQSPLTDSQSLALLIINHFKNSE